MNGACVEELEGKGVLDEGVQCVKRSAQQGKSRESSGTRMSSKHCGYCSPSFVALALFFQERPEEIHKEIIPTVLGLLLL